MIVIGIDPGKFGAYGVIRDNGGLRASWGDFPLVGDQIDWPEVCKVWKVLIDQGEPVVAVIEKVGAMPGQGVVSMFNFGKNAGILEGMLIALKIRYISVSPQTWKATVLRDTDKSKGAALLRVRSAWPELELPKTQKGKEGVSDALCIAHYGWLKYGSF